MLNKKILDNIQRFYWVHIHGFSLRRLSHTIKTFFYYGWKLKGGWSTDCGGFLEEAVNAKCKLFIKQVEKSGEGIYEDSEECLKKVKRLEAITRRLITGDNYRDTKYNKKLKELKNKWKDYSLGCTVIGGSYVRQVWRGKTGEVLGSACIPFDLESKDFQKMLALSKEIRSLQTKIFDIYGKREAKDNKDFKRILKGFDQYEY